MLIRKFLIIFIFLFGFSSRGFTDEIWHKCPDANVKNNIFDASTLYKGSRIAIEKGSERYPISLYFYIPAAKGCERNEFAKYAIEGSIPSVNSLFFVKMKDRVNVFSIVSWSINNRGEGTYGVLYQVYAYHITSGGRLSENKKISENNSMTGIEGYVNGQQSVFPYKTAAEVKNFWNNYLK